MKKRVLIFSLAPISALGGAEVATRAVVERLRGEFEFDVIDANLKSFWSKYFYPLWAYHRAKRWHLAKNYDVIWAIMANQAGMAAALFKRRFSSTPFLLTLQEGDDLASLAYRARLLFPRAFGVFRRADRLTAISNYLARWARAMGARGPIDVVPNGVDVDKIKSQKLEVKYRDQKSKVVITTSRLVRKNGIDVLVEAMRFLPENIKLQIVGSGPEEARLKLITKTLPRRQAGYNLEPRIKFTGAAPAADVPRYLYQADLFVRPSRSEGLGNSFLEAMAAGVPVIGTPVGGIPDFLFDPATLDAVRPRSFGRTASNGQTGLPHRQTGWFCRVDDPRDLAAKINFILDPANREQVASVVANARQLVRERYDWALITKHFSSILNELCA